ncbi:MAG: hypothetical protein HC810_06345 [Acaryochloridaceae cyanobacterium RL_2_7]|nr:hypothetical protein [Acaryochloridaceae cyanobacterium RL_2_7]
MQQWKHQHQVDLVIRRGSDLEFQDPGDGCHIIQAEIPEFGKFLMRQGKELVVLPAEGRSLESLRAIILGSAFSVILQQRNQLVLHASSIQINQVAIAFLGQFWMGEIDLGFHPPCQRL